MMKNNLVALLLLVGSFTGLNACNENVKNKTVTAPDYTEEDIQKQQQETAYFASGCFWCVEAIFQSVKGVKDAVSGYSGGAVENPTYRQVSSGSLKHAEAVKVIYDPLQVDFETLVKVFFGSHDPTTPNRQGPDRGPHHGPVRNGRQRN